MNNMPDFSPAAHRHRDDLAKAALAAWTRWSRRPAPTAGTWQNAGAPPLGLDDLRRELAAL
ncbi:MAG: hypothetical protein M3Z00_05120 [Actinomycetota bacterium]|nr:hypothetical protein [Actinomycetota bacterium]